MELEAISALQQHTVDCVLLSNILIHFSGTLSFLRLRFNAGEKANEKVNTMFSMLKMRTKKQLLLINTTFVYTIA